MTDIIARIKAEIARLDLEDEVVCLVDDEAPEGWVRIADDGARSCGLASEILAALRGAAEEDPEEFDDFGDHKGSLALWGALRDFPDGYPED